MDDVQIKKLNIKNLGHFKECRVEMNTYTACDNHMNITCPLNIQYMYAFNDAYIGDLYTVTQYTLCEVYGNLSKCRPS